MTPEATFVLFGVLSAAFGLAYFPVMNRMAKGVVSPYAKADLRKRVAAATIDGALVVICLVGFRTQGSAVFLLLAAVYVLLRDALFLPGHSIGKFLLGLVVADLHTGRPCSRLASAKRNFILVVPGLNVVAICLEALAVIQDRQGQRLGDRIANTQVIEGLGAKEFVKVVQQAMLDIELPGRVEKPVEEPLTTACLPLNVKECAETSRRWLISRRRRRKTRSARRPCSSFAS
ncbi:MAG: hypothetical protein EHM55_04825 [Acidobacteria bacterium]|nr:MAG: hypothetical protein EHM55_04825 [Acidobacteriota bacterium]